ncbi:MAG TPA: hypothetical protein VNF07_05035 [Acidimicrobiales bacterium]|nr:hypothetical protein [Acidimicrobiales bacterium]
MHPEQLIALNRTRPEELRALARPSVRRAPRRPRPAPRRLRQAAGWMLVEIGLHVATRGPANAGRAEVGALGGR